ncbi:YihY/virulence factor BrkB family protein [Sandaracinomonas limnophila]|uniref:YihY/virulence factor BrkB family protein n=1 Tax=Sandaracinomonas limnophila TaxID=1862386 RepID=A0A437PX48_9BACT|nr:YihY/virulence factor BrkB family protein [Sandaracinomonas limnophila]RVU26788.1 YihY/virulence factor BrkB family protein [Sandaracinomonas limnophila]
MKRKKLLHELKLFWKELEEHYVFFRVIRILYSKLFLIDIDVRAAAVAYNFTLAVFPTIIFLFSLLPYLPIEHFDQKVIGFLKSTVPPNLRKDLTSLVLEIVTQKRGGVLSFGFILALYASTSGIMALIKSFNMTYKTNENRGWMKERAIAVGLNFLLTFVLLVAILVFIVGNFLVKYLAQKDLINYNFNYYLVTSITYFVTFSVFFFTISIIYYYAPAIHKRWKFFNVGSITASILTILITNIFSYYLVNFANYHKVYGSIGSLIALMAWLYFIALILIVGFEINASIDQVREEEKENMESNYFE